MRWFKHTLFCVAAMCNVGSTLAAEPPWMEVEWVKSSRPVLQDSTISAPAQIEPLRRDNTISAPIHLEPLLIDSPISASPVTVANPPQATHAQWAIQLEDKTLSNTLTRWTQQAQWQLVWAADRDFPIEAQVAMEGGFHAAISMVMQSLADSDYPLQASMNPQTRVLRIVRFMQPRAK